MFCPPLTLVLHALSCNVLFTYSSKFTHILAKFCRKKEKSAYI